MVIMRDGASLLIEECGRCVYVEVCCLEISLFTMLSFEYLATCKFPRIFSHDIIRKSYYGVTGWNIL